MSGNGSIVPVKEQIADRLRTEIISGALEPGMRLTEEELASRFGVSRGRVRDVLLELSKEGLLVTRANKGTTVNDLAQPEVQALLMKMRLAIEDYAVAKVAADPSDETLEQLAEALATLRLRISSGDFAETAKSDIAFHRTVVAAAGGDDLVNLWHPMMLRLRMNYQRISDPEESVREHEAILAAIGRRDPVGALEALHANVR